MMSFRKCAAGALVFASLIAQACDGPTAPKTGSLTVNVTDLPADVAAAVTVTGPDGQAPIAVTGTRTIPDLPPGIYQVAAAKAVGQKSSYTPGTVAQTVEVVAGSAPASVTVGYTLATGIIAISITGLPAGASASLTVFNGTGVAVPVTSDTEVGNLEPGNYGVHVTSVNADEIYGGTASPASISVVASPVPVPVQVTYAATTGTIQLSSSGLPAGAVPTWDVRGPGEFGFTETVAGAATLSLARRTPGRYVITARNFDFGGDTYGTVPQSLTVDVSAGAKTPAAFSFVTRPPTLNLAVDGAYIVQSVQRYSGTVPLVADRSAFLRVFVRANETNVATPKVRVRFYRGGEVISTSLMNATSMSVGMTVNEGRATESWGVLIPETLIRPGTSYLVDVDPESTVREVNETDNQYPVSGIPLAMDVRSVPLAEIRFVPIATTVNGLVGDVTNARIATLLAPTLKMFPLATYSADVRAIFNTSAPLLNRNDSNGAWVQIINEINTLRVAEAAAPHRHYVGILRVPYPSGIAGLGFVPGRTTLSWDGASAPFTIAHELGHNWGRNHAPCGSPPGVDRGYPYQDASIGVYGFDLVTNAIQDLDLRDIMSYCRPEWVSDYTYEAVLNNRASVAFSSSVAASVGFSTPAAKQTSLIVWGRIEGTKLVLEPAFVADTRPDLPPGGGRYRVEGVDQSGGAVFSISFNGERIEDAATENGEVRVFAFAVPMSEASAARIASLRLAGDGREVRVNAMGGAPAANVTATAAGGDKVRLEWNSAQYPMLVVRDAVTREILAFARGGSSTVRTQRRALEVTATDRVRSSRMTVQVQ